MTIYSTTHQSGIDVNAVFYLDPVNALEYPSPPFQPGELAWGTDGSEWVYCTASTAITPAGAAVLISTAYSIGMGGTVAVGPGTWSVALLGGGTIGTAPFGQLVGIVGGSQGQMTVAAPSGTQTGAYFWVQRAGNCPNIFFPSSTGAAGATLSQLHSYSLASGAGGLTSTAGGSATTFQVNGVVFTNASASVTGPNTGVLNYPTAGATN